MAARGKHFRKFIDFDCPRCGAHRYARKNSTACLSCSPNHLFDQRKAHNAVNKAIRGGLLAPPWQFVCTDCGVPAAVYEHRDYSKPLEVEPVCRPCNSKRGQAIPFDREK